MNQAAQPQRWALNQTEGWSDKDESSGAAAVMRANPDRGVGVIRMNQAAQPQRCALNQTEGLE
jgi:hypothetical protein